MLGCPVLSETGDVAVVRNILPSRTRGGTRVFELNKGKELDPYGKRRDQKGQSWNREPGMEMKRKREEPVFKWILDAFDVWDN